MPFFERSSGPTRHIFKYGPSRIYCYDRPDSLLMPVGARRTYRSLLKWERKLPCATPLDGIARDLGAFWLLDQWFTVGLHGWAESMISSSDIGSQSYVLPVRVPCVRCHEPQVCAVIAGTSRYAVRPGARWCGGVGSVCDGLCRVSRGPLPCGACGLAVRPGSGDTAQ